MVDSPVPPSTAANDKNDVLDQLHDATFLEDILETYAVDPFFADDSNTVNMSFIQGLWWKEGRIVMPNSADTKQMVLQAMHDHPLAGHLGVTKTIKAVYSGGMLIKRCATTFVTALVVKSRPASLLSLLACCNL